MSTDLEQTESQTGVDAADDDPPPPEARDFAGGWATMDKTVFGWAFGIIAAICILGGVFTGTVGDYSQAALTWVTDSFGWLYILAASGFVAFALVLAFGRYGRIPLSRNGEPPEFSTISWVAMMFSAGMGIGLMFYGVYEPVTHMADPPPFVDAQPGSSEAARHAMAYTFFHWGLHPWAMYGVVGLALAYSTFRMGRGNLMSAPFQALFGKERIEDRGWGKPIDVLAIICTKFGSAVSLGLGALQVAAGIALLRTGSFPEEGSHNVAILVICVLTVGATISAASGVSRGIQFLSNLNMIVAFLLVVFVFVLGPTIFILNLAPAGIGNYLIDLIPMSFHSAAFGGGDWLASWTIFYWAWWISWTPFVGTFIARISRGRTIREFVLGVMMVPTAISIIWFVIFGGAGIKLQLGGVNIAGEGSAAAGFFAMLQHYPIATVTGGAVIFLTAIFFVSGADAGALVLATLSSRGRKRPWEPLIVLWAIMTGVVAGVLLYVGGLSALKTFAILSATPFVVVLIGLCVALYADLRRDPMRERRVGPVRTQSLEPPLFAPFSNAARRARQDAEGEPSTNGAEPAADAPETREPAGGST